MKIYRLILAAILLVAMSCTKEDNKNNDVALLLEAGGTIDRWKIDKEYLPEALSKYSQLNYTLYEADDEETQLRQLKSVLESGIRNVVITPIDFNEINDSGVLGNYPDANIICHSRLIFNNYRIKFYSSCEIEEIGRLQADYLVQQFLASGKESLTLEMFAGPSGDNTSTGIFNGAYNTLKPLIDKGYLVIKSGKKDYLQVALPEWTRLAASAELKDRLSKYYPDGLPDLLLVPNDECAFGIISAIDQTIEQKKISLKRYPAITGQDNSKEAQQYLENGKLGMTVDLSIKDMCYNTAMVVSSMCQGVTPATPYIVNNGAVNVPLIKCSIRAVYSTKVN